MGHKVYYFSLFPSNEIINNNKKKHKLYENIDKTLAHIFLMLNFNRFLNTGLIDLLIIL